MLLSLKNIVRRYPVEKNFMGKTQVWVTAVNGVTLELPPGGILGIVGESGCGKSTLARIAAGLERPDEGSVLWDGEEFYDLPRQKQRLLRRKVQMVFQNPFGALNPRQTCGETVEEPLIVHGVREGALRRQKVRAVLERVGLHPGDEKKYPHQFSGGQRQRVVLARALILEPEVLVLDEPLSALDVSVQSALLNLLRELNEEKKMSYLWISHDLAQVEYLAHRVAVLYLGRVVEEGPAWEVFQTPWHPYTQALQAAARTFQTRLAGERESVVSLPAGCVFQRRCLFFEEKCRQEPPWFSKKTRKAACWSSHRFS